MLTMSLLVLIVKTVYKSAANSWQMYELLVFFSLASTKKQPHTLQRSLTFVMCAPSKATPIIHKKTHVQFGVKKKGWLVLNIIYMLSHV